MQSICETFQHLLAAQGRTGFIIGDSRNKPLNVNVAHSIFTLKCRSSGDPLANIIELPLFGHSENHAGLQVADLVVSTLLFPLTMHAYCTGYVQNLHIRPGYNRIQARYGTELQRLQYRFADPSSGRWRGGIVVSDAHAHRPGGLLFR